MYAVYLQQVMHYRKDVETKKKVVITTVVK